MDHKYEKLLQDLVDISLLQKLKDILAHSSDEESILKLIKQEGIIPLDILENIPTGELRVYLEKLVQDLANSTATHTSSHAIGSTVVGATLGGIIAAFSSGIVAGCASSSRPSFTDPSEGTGGSDTNGEQNKPVGKTDK